MTRPLPIVFPGKAHGADTSVLVRAGLISTSAAVCASMWLLDPRYVALAAIGAAVIALTLRYPVAGLCLLAFSVPWASDIPGAPGGGSTVNLTDALIASLGVAWLVSASAARVSPISTRIWTPYVALFLAAIALSATQAADRLAAVRELVKWSELLVVYLAGVHFLRTPGEVRAVVKALVLAGLSQALLGFGQFLLGVGPQAFAEHRLFLRAYGSFDQPNPYAGFLNMVLPLALACAALERGRARKVYAVITLIIAGAVLVSQSRGATLAGAVSVTILAAVLWPRLRPAVWLGALFGLVTAWLASFGLVPTAPFERLLAAVGLGNVSFGSVTDANFSAIERAAHWLAGVRMFESHPLVGVGIGNFGAAYPAYHPRGWYASLEHAHNYYINVAAEAGIVGLIAYVLLAGSALWYIYAAIGRASDRLRCAVALGVLGALIATSLHNLFDVLFVHGMVALLGLLMALIPFSIGIGGDGLTAEQRSATSD